MERLACLAALVALFGAGSASAQTDEGLADRYPGATAGLVTASGEPYDPAAFTAAHALLRFGSRLAVTNPANGRTVTVRINDRCPSEGATILVLSRAASNALGLPDHSPAPVRVRVLRAGEPDAVPGAFVPPPEEATFFQMGAFRTLSNARTLVRALETKGHGPLVRREGGVFRVYLRVPVSQGPGLSEKLALEGWKGSLQLTREPRGEPIILPND